MIDAPLEAATDAGMTPVTCTPLGTNPDDAGVVYFSLNGTDDAGAGAWEFFDTNMLPLHAASAGGTFDGRYVYFAGRGSVVLRFDTHGSTFQQQAAWSEYDLSTTFGIAGAFDGAVFDGRYVYYVPFTTGSMHTSVVARFDTTSAATGSASAGSWTTFDLTSLSDAGAVPSGFVGAGFDGQYIYFVPHDDGVPDGRVVRYNTKGSDGGTAGDAAAGDAGDAAAASGTFGDLDALVELRCLHDQPSRHRIRRGGIRWDVALSRPKHQRRL